MVLSRLKGAGRKRRKDDELETEGTEEERMATGRRGFLGSAGLAEARISS